MKKKLLVIYFTQSGQMLDAAQHLATPFENGGDYEVHYERLDPIDPFPFPWSAFRFFNSFPDTFTQRQIGLKNFSARMEENWDLIVLAYQPWFLTPAPPIASFLQTADAKKLLDGKNVVTLIACRNMWLGAQEKVKKHLQNAGATLIANVALVDNAPNVVSLVTILRWLLWGKKNAFGVLPAAGVAAVDIGKAADYGAIIKSHLEQNHTAGLQADLNAAGAVEIKPELVLMEARGQRAFGIWSKFIGGARNGSFSRAVRVYVFMFLLPAAVLILSPLLMLISFLMLNLRKEKLAKEVAYYKQNSLR